MNQYEKAHETLAAYITQLGGTQASPDDAYRWTLETPLGALHLAMHEKNFSIFALWEDVDKAKAHFGTSSTGRLNRFSGKWNFHGLTEKSNPFEAFKAELDAVMALAAATAE